MARFVSIVSRIEQIFDTINWKEVAVIVNLGLRSFVTLTILAILYTMEGTVKVYNWTFPRLALLLQHPVQTIKNGPELLYTESIESLIQGNATAADKVIIYIGTSVDFILQFVSECASFRLSMMGRNLILTWDAIDYTLVAVDGATVYILGQRMI